MRFVVYCPLTSIVEITGCVFLALITDLLYNTEFVNLILKFVLHGLVKPQSDSKMFKLYTGF